MSGFQNLEFQDFRISKSKISRFQDFMILGLQEFKISRCQDVRISSRKLEVEHVAIGIIEIGSSICEFNL